VAWERIVKVAVDRKVDFVTLGGDVFDVCNPSIRARMAFKEGIARLAQAGIPVFLCLGNHDPLSDFPDYLRSLPGLHLFGPEPEAKMLSSFQPTARVGIYGASFENPAVRDNLVKRFRRHPDVEIAIGLVHTNVSGIPGHDDYAPCHPDDLRIAGMDVWCLGHVHLSRVLSEDPLILYPGTSQGAHINEAGPKGCWLVTVTGKGKATAEFVPVAPVKWEKLDVDVTNFSGEEDFLDAIEDAAARLSDEEGFLEAVVVRINLVGKDPGQWRWSEQAMTETADLLVERLARLPVPVFPESIHNQAASEVDLDSLIKEEGFLSDFLRLCRKFPRDPQLQDDLIRGLETEFSRKLHSRFLDPDLDPRRFRYEPGAISQFLQEMEQSVARMFLGRLGT
jgi:DNA repair exonuclease SbcCD nuclease subunit